MKAFIVQARLNFDDPVVGVYSSMEQAVKRAKQFEKKPELVDKYVDAWDVTGWIGATVYECNGTRIPVNVYGPGGGSPLRKKAS